MRSLKKNLSLRAKRSNPRDCFGRFWRPRNDKIMRNNQGFTLVEIMAATLIALPMLVLLMQIVPGMLRSRLQTELTTQGTILAIQKMEEIRSQIASNNASYGYSRNYNQVATAFPVPFGNYQFEVFDDQGSSQKELKVTVTKQAGYSVEINTRVARKN